VVDSEDLPLNISRETVQSNRLMQRLKQTISSKVIGELTTLAEKEPEKYRNLWDEFGRMFKEGVVTDSANKEKLAGLLRFHTSASAISEWTSLKDYATRMVEGQSDIYYLLGDDPKTISRSPHLEPFKARGIEVLLLTDAVDGFVISAIPEFDGKKLHNAADADLELPEGKKAEEEKPAETPLVEGALRTVIDHFAKVLGERVADVRESKVLTESPARLVSADKGLGADMERVYRALGQEFDAPKRILEINPRHPLIRNLSSLNDAQLSDDVVEALYGSALLDEGIHPNPADLVPLMRKLMLAATKG
jgi:molecular chaperone HtpG